MKSNLSFLWSNIVSPKLCTNCTNNQRTKTAYTNLRKIYTICCQTEAGG